MDDNKQDDAASPSGGSRKRTPPTIDLTAASVSDSASAPNDTGAAAASSAESSPRRSFKSWRDRLSAARAAVTPSIGWPSFTSTRAARPSGSVFSSMLVAAITGAAVALLVLGASWLMESPGGSSRILSRLPSTTAKSDMESPGKRVAKADSRASNVAAVSSPDPALSTRIDVLEKSVASLRDDAASARKAIEEIKAAPAPQAPEISAIEERISKVERATVALTGEIAAPQKPAGEDPRLRTVAAATLLDTSVRQGEPYATALASAKALTSDASSLKPLDEFATTGIPSANALSRELLTLLPLLSAKPAAAKAPVGLMNRLQQSASKLVRVQRTDGAVDPANAAVAQAKDAAQRNDLAAARRQLNLLSAADRAPVQPWLDKADAREAALNASKQFALDTMTSLSKPAQ